jgi:hypothetical protein
MMLDKTLCVGCAGLAGDGDVDDAEANGNGLVSSGVDNA